MDQLDLKILIRRSWLILLIMLIGGGAAFLFAQTQPKLYEAQTKLLVGPSIDSPKPDVNVLHASGQIIQTYAQLPLTEPFLQAMIDELHLKITTTDLAGLINILPNQETLILTIKVQYTNAAQAQSIANYIATKLIEASPSNPKSAAVATRGKVQTQAAELEKTIADTKQNIQLLGAEYQKITDENKLANQNGNPNDAILQELQTYENKSDLIGKADTQTGAGMSILQELLFHSNSRVAQLETELKNDPNTVTQNLISDQIRLERTHVSEIQQAIAEINRQIDGLPIDQYMLVTQKNIQDLEQKLLLLYSADYRRLQLDQIRQEQLKLSQAHDIEGSRQKLIMQQIANERDRISAIDLSHITKQKMILDQITLDQTQLSDAQKTLSLLYTTIQAADPNQVKLLEPAGTPTPITPPIMLMALIGAVAAGVLSVVGILLFAFFDRSVTTTEQAHSIFPVPAEDMTAGTIPFLSSFQGDKSLKDHYYRYQMLGMRFLYGFNEGDKKLVVIGSTDGNIDNGSAATSLAITLAKAGQRVILVDANEYNPSITSHFGLSGQKGLTDYLAAEGKQSVSFTTLDQIPNLTLIPVGSAPMQLALLSSPQLAHLLEYLEKEAEVVLFSIPDLQRPESIKFASQARGILVVVNKGKTTRQELQDVADSLNVVGVKTLAVVLENNRSLKALFDWLKVQALPLSDKLTSQVSGEMPS